MKGPQQQAIEREKKEKKKKKHWPQVDMQNMLACRASHASTCAQQNTKMHKHGVGDTHPKCFLGLTVVAFKRPMQKMMVLV